jgi:hypothetical protein
MGEKLIKELKLRLSYTSCSAISMIFCTYDCCQGKDIILRGVLQPENHSWYPYGPKLVRYFIHGRLGTDDESSSERLFRDSRVSLNTDSHRKPSFGSRRVFH